MSHTIMLTCTVKCVQFKDVCCWNKLSLQLHYELFISCAGKNTHHYYCVLYTLLPITMRLCLLFGYFATYLFADFSREHLHIKHSPPCFFWAYLQKSEKLLLALPCLSVCWSLRSSTWNKSAPTGQIFMKCDFNSF